MSAPEFTAHFFPARLYLAVGPRQFHAACREWGKAYRFVDHHAATVTILPGVYLPVLSRGAVRLPHAELAGILAHEATHCCQAFMQHANEPDPGVEAQAYLTQAIVEWAWKIVVDGAVN